MRRSNRPNKCTRGISTVIANVLMVTIVVSLGTGLFIWASGGLSTFESASSVFFEQRNQAIQEIITIEDVWFNSAGAKITVRNAGTINVVVASIYVNGTRVTASPLTPSSLNVRSATSFSIASSALPGYNSNIQQLYYITIATQRGTTIRAAWVTR